MSATALFLLLGLVLAFAGVFAALFSGEKRIPPRAPAPAPRRRAARTPAPPPARAPQTPVSRSRPLSRREREEMLDGIRNLARDNPARTAALVRSWLNA